MSETNAKVAEKTTSESGSFKQWWDWKWWLPYLGGIAATVVLLGTVLTFTISISRDVYYQLTFKDKIDIITVSSTGPHAFLNSGDGELFLSHVDVRGAQHSEVIYLNSVIKPHQFLTVPVSDQISKELGGKQVVTANSDEEWNALMQNKIRGFADPSYVPVIFDENSPALKLYKEHLGAKLRTFAVQANLVYYNSGGTRLTKPVRVEGLILH